MPTPGISTGRISRHVTTACPVMALKHMTPDRHHHHLFIFSGSKNLFICLHLNERARRKLLKKGLLRAFLAIGNQSSGVDELSKTVGVPQEAALHHIEVAT